MFANVHPLGFLAAAKAQDAEQLIDQTERLVSTLVPTEANLRPAHEALSAAKSLYAAQEYSKAVAQAKRAAALAVSLNERFNAYLAAWKVVQSCLEELELLGFPTEAIEAALGAADKEVVRLVAEDGTVVPNYAGATEMLERAAEDARTLVTRARGASREIFLATLAVEGLSDSPTTQAPSWLAVRLEEMVEQATRELASGDLAAATRVAGEARARADDARAGATRAWELLDMTAAILEGLEAEGPLAHALTAKVESARTAVTRGFLDRTSALLVARRLSDEVASFAKSYPEAQRVLERADRVYARLREHGLIMNEVDSALSEAHRSLEGGDWAAVRERVGSVSQAFQRLRGEQQALTRAITEIDERVDMLKGFRLPLLPEVETLLGQAKEEVRCGRISAANEDVVLASRLMKQATRTGS